MPALKYKDPADGVWKLVPMPAGATGGQGLQGPQGDPATNLVTSVAGRTGAISLAKADVGLASVDNVADISKPVSTLQQTALDLKNDRILVNEFWASAAPTIPHNADTAIVFNTTGANEGGVTRTGTTANIVVSKAGWFTAGGRVKYQYFNSVEIKLVWAEVNANRVGWAESTSRDGWLSFSSPPVYATVGQIFTLKSFQFTGTSRLIDPGLFSCGFVVTWLRA